MTDNDFSLQCPIPTEGEETITLGHGSGGRLMQQLLQQTIFPPLADAGLQSQNDAAVLQLGNIKLAMTTDSYVIHPHEFPGGDIGSLAVTGTVNDLAVVGARPHYLSVGLILESGFCKQQLNRILQSMANTARQAQVELVTGDTKVVEAGKGDGIYINTAGIGLVETSGVLSPREIQVGDSVIVSGDLGRHGIAVMASREGLSFEKPLLSDMACLHEMVLELVAQSIPLRCLRDLTRGGLASALNELAESAELSMQLKESAIPVQESVQGACELLGLSPFYVANEGRLVAIVPPAYEQQTVSILQQFAPGQNAACIGKVQAGEPGRVTLMNDFGVERLLDRLQGDQLPRIC